MEMIDFIIFESPVFCINIPTYESILNNMLVEIVKVEFRALIKTDESFKYLRHL